MISIDTSLHVIPDQTGMPPFQKLPESGSIEHVHVRLTRYCVPGACARLVTSVSH